ncbi:MAG: TIGR01777 family oxidoreductase [Planctomycetota bacterium]
MSPSTFEKSVTCPVPAEETFAWHVRPGALRRLLPPWDSASVKAGSGPEERLEKGARTTIRVGAGPVGIDWVAEISELDEEATYFVDTSLSGPFKSWVHRHQVTPQSETTSSLTDHIDYELPLGALGRLFGGRFTRGKLERMFAWRHRVMLHDLDRHAHARTLGFEGKTIAITGASGLVGRSLAAFLRTGGHRVLELVRRPAKAPHEVEWNPREGAVDHAALEGIDALVHLAGESIFGLRWTQAKKERITQSRILGTRAIVDAIGRMERPPKALVSASAIGWYGDRGDETLPESAPRGDGFLAETCAAWEAEVDRLREDVRSVKMRLGVVLDPGGGALDTMLPAFRAGVGGRLGSGQQWFPWIVLDDVIGAFHRALVDERLTGPVNLVAPGEVTNATFTKTLGKVLRRPTVIPVPGFGLRMAIGKQQAQEMLLSSVRVTPKALTDIGFSFRYPALEGALMHALGLQR